jgi:CBS domain-containing protein
MKVGEILDRKGHDVATTARGATLVEVAERMRREQVGALVVSADGSRVDGLITEREVVHAIARHGPSALDLHAGEIMIRTVATCSSDDKVRDVMTVMTRSRTRHLPVVHQGRLQGIVSIGDVVKSFVDDVDLEVTVLREAYLGRR